MERLGWDNAAREYSRYLLSSGKSQGTVRTYISNVKQFWEWCTDYEIAPDDADRRLVREWVADRREISASRAHNDLCALKSYYGWLIDARLRDDDPTVGLHVKRGKILPTKPLTQAEVDALLNACESERDRLIVLMFLGTGARVTEMADLQATDVDWQQGCVIIRGKGDKERLAWPRAEILSRLLAFMGMFPTGPLWMSQWGRPLSAHQIRKLLYDWGDRAKITDLHPHRLRSTYATMYIEQHGDIEALQGLLGHQSLDTTHRYTAWTQQDRGRRQSQALTFLENYLT